MCDYEGCASKNKGMIRVIRLSDNKELMLCAHCALCHLVTKLAVLGGAP